MSVKRRQVLMGAGALAGVGALAAGGAHLMRTPAPERPRVAIANSLTRRPNVILVTTDQERAWDLYPAGFIEKHCPARSRLLERGVSLTRAHTPSQICSIARGVLYTGAHPQNTSLWENVPLPYASNLKESVPTLGTLFQDAGYRTAYAGKWHMTRLAKRGKPFPPDRVKAEVSSYGFEDVLIDREIDGPLYGFKEDDNTVANALKFLADARADNRPHFLAVNLVNPHDIMYYTANDEMRRSRKVMFIEDVVRPPDTPLYNEDLGYDVIGPWGADSRAGKPEAVSEYARTYELSMGEMPFDDPSIARDFQNYYWNATRDCDRRLETLLDGLDAMGAFDDTIIIFTSDHGEFLGAHGLRGKGVTPYREASTVPLVIAHPDGPASASSAAFASLVDIAPTALALAGVNIDSVRAQAPSLVGYDLSEAIANPAETGPRDGVLMHWTSLAFIDHLSALAFQDVIEASGPLKFFAYRDMQRNELTRAAEKRGQMRGIFDGRYKFARYFSPKRHHQPTDWNSLTALNDLELYDTAADPEERVNLAADPTSRTALLAMNEKLNKLIDQEIGADTGDYLPDFAQG